MCGSSPLTYRALAACCALIASAPVVASLHAQSIPQQPAAGHLDATLIHARRALRDHGPQSAFFGAARPDAARAGLLVSLRAPGPCPALGGARWIARVAGGPLERAALCAGWAPWGALDALAASPEVRAVRWAGAPLMALPAAPLVSTQLAARGLRARVGGTGGAGVRIVDVDGPVDLLHPALFDADGGAFDWVDADADGALTLGVDGVDLDRDGRVSPRERLSLVDATRVARGQQEASDERGTFEPDQDWLYVDRNNDGRRNAGPDEGFREADLAYGEPIFVVDDIDQDGRLGPGERLLRLGRSKIVAVVDGPLRYERGVDLIRAAIGADEDTFHGTAVAGLLVGGQADAHSLVGVAPDAALEIHVLRDPADALVRVAAALDATPAGGVVAHEWSLPGELMDGGTALDAALTQAAQDAPQLVAAGNMHLARRHLTRMIAGEATLGLVIPEDDPDAGRVEIVVQWPDATPVQLALVSPLGDRLVAADGKQQEAGRGQIAWSRERSTRGGQLWRAVLWTEEGQVEAGAWSLEISAGAPVEVWARVFDRGSPWLRGVGWADVEVSDRTLVMPAAADGVLVMAALGGLEALEDGSQAGELRRYSGRGPTLSGAQPLMLAAPDDALAPLYLTQARQEVGWGVGWYAPFGGTSGALAMGVGAAALMRSARPALPAPALIAALIEAADGAALIPPAALPDVGWGMGRLDLAAALGQTAGGDARPVLRAEAARDVTAQALTVDARGSADPDGGPIEVWVDVGYDGRPEVVWEPAGLWRLPDEPCEDASCLVRVRIRDAQGQQSGALLVLGAAVEPGGMDGDLPEAPGDADGPRCMCAAPASRPAASPSWSLAVALLFVFRRARRG